MQFGVVNWSVWRGDNNSSAAPAAINHLPASLKRRLNNFGKSIGNVAAPINQGEPLIVFASRYGDAARSVNILKEIASGEPISPMHFSLSVHNAVPGVLSIGWGLTEMQSVISAGEKTFEMGLVEAASLLCEFPQKQVLYVYADYPLPEIFEKFEDPVNAPTVGVFLLEVSGGTHSSLCLDLQTYEVGEADIEDEKVKAFEEVLLGKRNKIQFGGTGIGWEVIGNVA
ncbi:beta-ketoacyl synthase chain length factor [Sneathiella glossodoripedis]|uniref:beta-ketoacyl synthase chain length factor n=1 Tax=Sneathiella glossodoripedis TaxID=418853 RepID=UPI0004721C77|nr:beta-ketoacyl synthase chain length factor [Sneathiella glossodoripedis]